MTIIYAIGWFAAALCILVFAGSNALQSRIIAVCANITFILYGVLISVFPIVALHLILLPINLYKIRKLYNALAEKSGPSLQN
jgi:hypothetical protein